MLKGEQKLMGLKSYKEEAAQNKQKIRVFG